MPRNYTPRVALVCTHCGGEFFRPPSAIAAGRGRHCSRACKDAARENKVSLVCETCGTTFERKRSLVRERVFCSRLCDLTKNARPIEISDDGLTARVPLVRRDGSVAAYAIIDAADAEWVGQWTWNLTPAGRYAVRGDGIKLHRELLGLKRGDARFGDHINRDTLDDRRGNLRILSASESPQNVPGRPGSSRHRGVSWYAPTGKWVAYVNVNHKRHHLGYFETEEQAATAARDARARLMPAAID